MRSRPRNRDASPEPILWIGGTGLPGGATGRDLVGLGRPLHWAPVSRQAVEALYELAPRLVVVEAERLTASVKELLAALKEVKESLEVSIFVLQSSRKPWTSGTADGYLMRGRGLVSQLEAALAALGAADRFRTQRDDARRQVKRLQRKVNRLRELVVRDDLTSLYNLRFFNRSLESEHSRAIRFGRQYSLIFLDLDGLREVNNRHGHLAGASVLRQVGEFISSHIRRIDIAARVGGDEFVIICPETGKVSTRTLAERLREGIESDEIIYARDSGLVITASLGVASFPADGDLPEHVLERADQALYEAKARGRNRVCCWGEFPADPKTAKRASVQSQDSARDLDQIEAESEDVSTGRYRV